MNHLACVNLSKNSSKSLYQMAFLLAIPAFFMLNEMGDVVADKAANVCASTQSFCIEIKRKIWDKKKGTLFNPPQQEHKKYSEDYQQIKKKYDQHR